MIISASRRTDIPAFYSKWFMNRVREGFLVKVNPLNAKQKKSISLNPTDVDIIVFWTKNPQPIISSIPELQDRTFNFMFQFTLNDYPRDLEPNVPSLNERISTFRNLYERIGSDRIVWRYDPIIFSNKTSESYHIDKFSQICAAVSPFTHRVVISFVDMYGKVSKKFRHLENSGYLFEDPCKIPSTVEKLSASLSKIAKENNLEIFSCSEKFNLDDLGIAHGSCIDASLISKILNKNILYKKDKGQRQECLCTESIDIGMYNTCRFNCEYCYATLNKSISQQNYLRHNPDSPILIGDIDSSEIPSYQLKLF